MDATKKRRRPPIHHGEVPTFDYLPQQREHNCIKVRMTLKKGEWPITFHVPGVWFRDIVSNTRQWVDARYVKWLIEVPGTPEEWGPMIITEEWRRRRRSEDAGALSRLNSREGLLVTAGFLCGVATTFVVLIASALFNNAATVLAAVL